MVDRYVARPDIVAWCEFTVVAIFDLNLYMIMMCSGKLVEKYHSYFLVHHCYTSF